MTHAWRLAWLALLLLPAGGASATTVGALAGKAVTGRPLAVNVPFAVDQPADRACAVAGVRYGTAATPPVTLHVQGHGARRNLRVTSRAKVGEEPVRVDIRVGCGARAVTRKFVLLPAAPVTRTPPKPVAFTPASEPLFPPPAPAPEPASVEELRKAQDEAATAATQLAAARRELAAVLDVERRTSQTLFAADRQAREAQAEVAHMRLVLKALAAVLALAAAGVGWFEFARVAAARRAARARPAEEPALDPAAAMAA